MAQYYQPQPSYDFEDARRAVDELVRHMQVPVYSHVIFSYFSADSQLASPTGHTLLHKGGRGNK